MTNQITMELVVEFCPLFFLEMFVKKLLLLCMVSLSLMGCVSSQVAVVDNTAVGNDNIHVVIESDSVEDRIGVGPVILKYLEDKQISSELGHGGKHFAQSGTGSGFLVAGNKWLTNYHVIKDLDSITISYAGKNIPATVIATDEHNDLALLKADSGDLKSIKFATAEVGNSIYVSGYPLSSMLGDYARLTTGNISSLYGFDGNASNIQITAPISPGNSGGPVTNTDFEAVGVVVSTANTVAMANRIGSLPQGLNFAVSPNVATGFLLQNGVETPKETVDSVQALLNSTALIWNGDSTKQKRTYIAKFTYRYYWDLGNHLSYMRLHLIDSNTGETVLKSSLEADSMGIQGPVYDMMNKVTTELGIGLNETNM